jgi:lipopolysaccharide assembly protein A
MRVLLWLVRAAFFLLVLGLAIKNTAPVTVRWYLGHEGQAPLAFVLLATFAIGAATGVLAGLGWFVRQRRVVTQLRRELDSARAAREESRG